MADTVMVDMGTAATSRMAGTVTVEMGTAATSRMVDMGMINMEGRDLIQDMMHPITITPKATEFSKHFRGGRVDLHREDKPSHLSSPDHPFVHFCAHRSLSWRVAEGIPPSALSDPYVKLSLHTAPIRQTRRLNCHASARKDLFACELAAPAIRSRGSRAL